jgi:GNAT superfamily N-acetyltransferase
VLFLRCMLHFLETTEPPETLRQAYLDGLQEPQELYLERLVSRGRTWRFGEVAYAVANHGRLVEFFVAASHAARIGALFDAAMTASGARSVLCKSFDTQLLLAALSRPAEVTPTALLFRRIADASFAQQEALTFRIGSMDDVAAIARLDDGFFDGISEIQSYVEAGRLFLLRTHGEFAGCGIATPVITGRADIDVGMWVAPNHRGKGYGSHIAAYLKHHDLYQGLRPICGCSTANIPSYRALTAAGFASEHRILQIVRRP